GVVPLPECGRAAQGPPALADRLRQPHTARCTAPDRARPPLSLPAAPQRRRPGWSCQGPPLPSGRPPGAVPGAPGPTTAGVAPAPPPARPAAAGELGYWGMEAWAEGAWELWGSAMTWRSRGRRLPPRVIHPAG